jgi:hypothetical protein
MADDTDSFPSSSIPKFRVGQLVRFYDHNYKRNVTSIVTFCERQPKTPNSKNSEFTKLLFIDYTQPI